MKMRKLVTSIQKLVECVMAQVTFSMWEEVMSLLGEGARNISRHLTTWVRQLTCSRM